MTRNIFVVCVFMYSDWVDVAEFDDYQLAFLKLNELTDYEISAKIVRRWVGEDHINVSVIN